MSHTYSLSSFSPSSFKNAFCLKHIDYVRGQHDSIEFLRTLLDDISKEININKNISAYKELTTKGKTKEEQNKEYHEFFISRENSIIIDLFYTQIINIFKCDCGFESYSCQKLLDIPLLLPMKSRETDLLSLIETIAMFESDIVSFISKFWTDKSCSKIFNCEDFFILLSVLYFMITSHGT
jgi:ubiquitin C-terminal hydrolase